MYHITKGCDNMRKTPEIPELLQEYIEAMPDSRLLFLKKEIPNGLIEELIDYQTEYNKAWGEPVEKQLLLLPIEEKWRYERVPVPEELRPYVIGFGIGLISKKNFKFVPPHLWVKLFKFKRAENKLNEKKYRRNYEECYSDMTWKDYKNNI